MPPNQTAEERFWRNVIVTPTCWTWDGNTNRRGYGTFWDGNRKVLAHRWSYEQAVGQIPEGSELDHMCRNPPCVRPDHLEPMTHKRNMENRSNVGRGKSGHRGVFWVERVGQWRVEVKHNYKNHTGGYFKNKADAIEKAIQLRTELFSNSREDTL